MKDLRKSLNVNDNNPKREFNFKPFKWIRRNWKNIIVVAILFFVINLLFNPGGVSSFISGWLSEFNSNWEI
ncbi:MAG: hypothetical protein SLAVMIC_00537 [uncultured marine phage]|uniref:Uncharacterized protein n=1 Tax=uncultured marine phage TaxID=707152 RepID=A0A8D9FQV3_9VIRU|nr:MAG: hypothetical protein SLAVMIC_00537 [uncultured marine phage]